MEIMEDGNLMDRVQILVQRDLQYYKQNQKILQQSLCISLVGGVLDFPRNTSFAAVKLVEWWEEEFVSTYKKSSGLIKFNNETNENNAVLSNANCDPDKFASIISKTADILISHLHILTQEALDHADLTVLTGTIGAAALLRNCLWFYLQNVSKMTSSRKKLFTDLQNSYKRYYEMTESLAERLLDLHCRLLSLYILQDSESLYWESTKLFFESERGSYIVQMWWLYMQGTRENLWSTVPPKMAKRIYSCILNETLTVFTARYIQVEASSERNSLLVVDISNILQCVRALLPAVCEDTEELIGSSINSQKKLLRDIHMKCQTLFYCLFIQKTPLHAMDVVVRQKLSDTKLSNWLYQQNGCQSLWMLFTSSVLFSEYFYNQNLSRDLLKENYIVLELAVLQYQPQPNLTSLLKIILKDNCKLITIILQNICKQFLESSVDYSFSNCKNFLCSNECQKINFETDDINLIKAREILQAVVNILLVSGNYDGIIDVLLSTIELSNKNWSSSLDRYQIWILKKPIWLDVIINLIKPSLNPIVPIVIEAMRTGASVYQAVSIILACITEILDCFSIIILRLSLKLENILPSNIHPIGGSVFLQFVVSAFYSILSDEKVSNSYNNEDQELLRTLNEHLCSIDEDNKHTEDIDNFLHLKQQMILTNDNLNEVQKFDEINNEMAEIITSDLLILSSQRKGLMLLYDYLLDNKKRIIEKLISSSKYFIMMSSEQQNMLYTMFHIEETAFDQLLTEEWNIKWNQFLKLLMTINETKRKSFLL